MVRPEAQLQGAWDLLLVHGILGLPVVDEGGKLVGIRTEQDCLRVAFVDGHHHATASAWWE